MSGQTTLGVLVLAIAYVRFGCIPRKEADVPMSRGGGASFEREWPARTQSNWPPKEGASKITVQDVA
ncbi:hypothetical protein M405DRAFT_828357 [Rhizopogon salebrosus TDB-379]|nr:hypothetical protein M405DRAFT_828357 [Rhizopogon salebrosus TDB-379]